jgi:hypothetical protein
VGGLDDPAPCAPRGVAELVVISSPRVRMCGWKRWEVAARGPERSRSRGPGTGPAGAQLSGSGARSEWRPMWPPTASCRGGGPSCASPIGTPAASLRTDRFAPFWPDLWGSARSLVRQAALWSSLRRPPETTSRSRPPCRTPKAPGARARGTPRPAPTPESAGAQSSTSRPRSR